MKNLNSYYFLFIFVFVLSFESKPQIKINENLTYSFDSIGTKTNTKNNENLSKNAVHLELLGNGILYSLGYERILLHKQKHTFYINTGFSYWLKDYGIHPQVGYLFGNKHKFELGFGYTIFIRYEDNLGAVEKPQFINDNVYFLRIGYRFQRDEEGFFYKAAFTPFHFQDNWVFPLITPWIGLAIGYSF